MNNSKFEDAQERFIGFLYAAAVSTLIARTFWHQTTLTQDDSPWTLLFEGLLLSGAVIFIWTDWSARVHSRRRLRDQLNLFYLLLSVSIEIIGLIMIVLAFGNIIIGLYDPSKSVGSRFVLFGAFAFMTWIWEGLMVKVDPLTFKEIFRASIKGGVADLERVRNVWQSPLKRIFARIGLGESTQLVHLLNRDPSSRGWKLTQLLSLWFMRKSLNGFYHLYHQFIAQHIIFFNLAMAIILFASTLFPLSAYSTYSVSVGFLVPLGLMFLSFVLFCIKGHPVDGLTTQPTRTTPNALITAANSTLILATILLYITLGPEWLICWMISQQFLVTLSFLAPDEPENLSGATVSRTTSR